MNDNQTDKKFPSRLLLPLLLLLLAGCTEVFYLGKLNETSTVPYRGAPTAADKDGALYYKIDCEGGVICFEPDEERTSIVNNLVIKHCVWNWAPYQNRGEGRLWISFSKSAESCWQLNRETFEDAAGRPLKLPPDIREMRVQ